MVTLFCPETPGLHLGPGAPGSPNVIDFHDGYAEVDENDPLYAEKMRWINTFGCPPIRKLEVDEVPTTDPNAVKCPACGDAFATDRKLNGHIMGAHRNRAGA
jgi:hypothetical protein